MLILVRHGRTEANAGGLLLGRADPPLDDVGAAQARAVARAMGDLEVDVVVTSPLHRARATAAAIADLVRVEPVVDERWIELDYGDFDGRSAREVPAAVWESWRQDPSWVPPGGESLVSCGERVRAACEALAEEAAERTVVVVSHVSPIKAASAWALGVGVEVAWRMYVAPASITRVGIMGGRPLLRSFNEVGHLERPP